MICSIDLWPFTITIIDIIFPPSLPSFSLPTYLHT